MRVKKDQDGRRYVEAEVEVPGSPEQVWRAIATGEGISSWFVPSRVEQREGGEAASSFGPGMDAVSQVTRWDPPHSYRTEADGGSGPVATEWIVEARDGGSCVVRVVHRWFADNDDWDGEYEGHAYGWATSYFRMLWLYLTRFPGQRCTTIQLTAFSTVPAPPTWRAVKGALRIDGQGRFVSAPGAPELGGVVEELRIEDPELLRVQATSPQVAATLEGMDGEYPDLLLRLEQPAPGLAQLYVTAMGDQAMVSLRFHLYGEQGAAAAAEAERQWTEWVARTFPQEGPD